MYGAWRSNSEKQHVMARSASASAHIKASSKHVLRWRARR